MIGVILRDSDNRYTLNKEIKEVISAYGYTCIGIYPDSLEQFKSIANLCNGFILQGGTDYKDIEIDMVRYLYENDIPTLGICLGMQMMCVMNGTLENLNNLNHKSTEKYVHEIIINKDSKLYSILENEKIMVNSRHIEHIKNTKLDVSAKSNDNIIEAVEDKNKKFFVGVQWHPESLMDDNSNKIFTAFFNTISYIL